MATDQATMQAAFQRMEQIMQQQSEQIAQLTAQMLGQQQATTAAQEQVRSQQQMGETVAHAAAAAAAAAVQGMRTNTDSTRSDNTHKYVEKPDAFLGTVADWERFKFSLSTWCVTVDTRLPENLEACAKLTDEMSEVDMEDSTIELNHKLYVRLWTC